MLGLGFWDSSLSAGSLLVSTPREQQEKTGSLKQAREYLLLPIPVSSVPLSNDSSPGSGIYSSFQDLLVG